MSRMEGGTTVKLTPLVVGGHNRGQSSFEPTVVHSVFYFILQYIDLVTQIRILAKRQVSSGKKILKSKQQRT